VSDDDVDCYAQALIPIEKGHERSTKRDQTERGNQLKKPLGVFSVFKYMLCLLGGVGNLVDQEKGESLKSLNYTFQLTLPVVI
jgi:hypothetical protein